MPPKSGGGGGDKKGQLWEGIMIQKLQQVRHGLANSGIVPASRNDDGLTTFLMASFYGKDKSLAEMVRWYERRDRELRMCLELCEEDNDRSSLQLACLNGHADCVKVLLDASSSLDRNNAFAKQQVFDQPHSRIHNSRIVVWLKATTTFPTSQPYHLMNPHLVHPTIPRAPDSHSLRGRTPRARPRGTSGWSQAAAKWSRSSMTSCTSRRRRTRPRGRPTAPRKI
jgi:hypothetical protein